MGLSIHYDGHLKKEVELSELINEVEEICKTNNWDVHTFIDTLPKDNVGKQLFKNEIFGLVFSPPKCDPVFLCFNSEGKLSNPIRKMIAEQSNEDIREEIAFIQNEFDDENEFGEEINLTENMDTTSVKTIYAGMEVHKKLIELFRYLSKKYFSEFTMNDEANFWETGDENELRSHFEISESDLKLLAEKFGTGERTKGETNEEYLDRIMKSYNKC